MVIRGDPWDPSCAGVPLAPTTCSKQKKRCVCSARSAGTLLARQNWIWGSLGHVRAPSAALFGLYPRLTKRTGGIPPFDHYPNKKYGAHTYPTFSGFCCSTDTSRMICTSSYLYSCGTCCCCITGTCTRVYNTQNNTGRKWHGFSADIEIDLVVECVVGIDLISVWEIGIDSSVWEIRIARFECRDRNWLGCVWGSKMTWFRVWIKTNFVVSERIEIDLF